MTRDQMIELALEAGWTFDEICINEYCFQQLTKLVEAVEREACVRRAEIALLGGAKVISDHVLDAIRARGKQ